MTAPPPSEVRASELLPTLLGDYWFHSRAHIPSSTLVALLGEFGVGVDAARATLSRLARAGRLEGRRDGRRTSYRLAPPLAGAAAALGQRLMAYGAEPVAWDGRWTCVAFSLPDAEANRRRRLRTRLRALGLGPRFDGLWITPHAPLEALDRCLADLGVDDAVVLRADEVPRPAGGALVDAWDLPALRARLDDVAAAAEAVASQLGDGSVGPPDALRRRTDLMGRWRHVAASDPRLPDELLPDGWPLRRARARFVAAYDALGPLAEARVRELAGGDDGPDGPRHHRVADIT